jgi:hypothetical protein
MSKSRKEDPVNFFQLGGFQAHTNRWHHSPLKELFLYPHALAQTLYPVDAPLPAFLRNDLNELELTLGRCIWSNF